MKPEYLATGGHTHEAATPVRFVALGASNLTRGFGEVVSSVRGASGPEAEILAALGHGRSYGADSRVLLRSLPAILDCGLWRELFRAPPLPTRALVTDVGNDIPHGRPPERILGWVEECVCRLREAGADEILLTDLPIGRLRRLSPRRYLLFRSLFFPASRLPLAEAAAVAEEVSAGLAALAHRYALRLIRPRSEWYGFDPIHIRRTARRAAWSEILAGGRATETGFAEAAQRVGLGERAREAVALYRIRLRPERQRLLGFERRAPQAGTRLPRGGRIRLY
jgi:hypothetical protein